MISQITILISTLENGFCVSIMDSDGGMGQYCKNKQEIAEVIAKRVGKI